VISSRLHPPALADIADAVESAILRVCADADVEDDADWVRALNEIQGYGHVETFLDFTDLSEADQARVRSELALRQITRSYFQTRSRGQAVLDWLKPWGYAFAAIGIYVGGCIAGQALTQFFFGNR